MSVLAVLAALAISAWAKAAPGVFATLLTSVFSRRVPPASSALASPGLECPQAPRLPTSAALGYRRIVVVGDVHGSSDGLREVLVAAGVISGGGVAGCARLATAADTVVVQLGDLVDRGPNATAAWDCLDELQATSGGVVRGLVRLVGNHELMWLQGRFRYARKDSASVRRDLVGRMREGIADGSLVGAASLLGGQLLFTHAGLRCLICGLGGGGREGGATYRSTTIITPALSPCFPHHFLHFFQAGYSNPC